MTQKQIAVIGGGVIGVTTAFFLAEAGHDVVVIERRQNVAQESSFAHGGIVSPAYASPWAAPGMPGKFLSFLFRSTSPISIRPASDRSTWKWIRRWMSECELDRYRINSERIRRLAFYSRDILAQMREYYQIEYERTEGLLQLFRTTREMKLAEPAIALLSENDIPHQLLDAESARTVEPALASDTALAGALYFPQDEAGNCPLFTKRLKQIASSMGVRFHFASTVQAIEPESRGVALRINDSIFPTDAVVVAAGIESMALLKPLGIRMPLQPVRGHSITALIKNFERAPRAALLDEQYKTTITRMGNRIRISGTAELGPHGDAPHPKLLHTLLKAGGDWFPDAANFASANAWSGITPMLPDGPPVLGATSVPNLYLNLGHGSNGWAMAAGSGKILADLISDRTPDIDLNGLTLARYGQN